MKKFFYKSGTYPTTRQGYLSEYIEVIFKSLKRGFLSKFQIEDYYKFVVEPNFEKYKNHKFMANRSAYLIYDSLNNKIVDLAFEDFSDFVWILQVLNIDKVEFYLPEEVLEKCQNKISNFKDRIILE